MSVVVKDFYRTARGRPAHCFTGVAGRRLLLCPDPLGQEIDDGCPNLTGVGLQREMAGVEQMDLGMRGVAPKRLGASRQEERIVPPPDGEHRRAVRAEVRLEL